MLSHKQYLEEVNKDKQLVQLTDEEHRSKLEQYRLQVEGLQQQLHAALGDAKAADSRAQLLKEEQVQLEVQLQAAVRDSQAADASSNRLREELRLTKDEMATLKEQEVK
eukprot:217298-Amphidinium_carterae.1